MKADTVDYEVIEADICIKCICNKELVVGINCLNDFGEMVVCKCKRVYVARYTFEVEKIES